LIFVIIAYLINANSLLQVEKAVPVLFRFTANNG